MRIYFSQLDQMYHQLWSSTPLSCSQLLITSTEWGKLETRKGWLVYFLDHGQHEIGWIFQTHLPFHLTRTNEIEKHGKIIHPISTLPSKRPFPFTHVIIYINAESLQDI